MHLLKLGLVVTLFGCGGAGMVSKYSTEAKVGPQGVDATYSWGTLGDRFRNGGMINIDPPLGELDALTELAKWSSYSPERSCFELVAYHRTAVIFEDSRGNSEDNVDWKRTKHELTTSSGQTLKSEPADVRVEEPFEVHYGSRDDAAGQYIPTTERYLHVELEVCFRTPKPLDHEQWVRWSYTLSNKARVELTFNVHPGG